VSGWPSTGLSLSTQLPRADVLRNSYPPSCIAHIISLPYTYVKECVTGILSSSNVGSEDGVRGGYDGLE
jgi:hypothetical protein